ncbi:MAG: hypothetical protein K6D90_09230, partial [Lachnospiraceae bacterium]|nr:hypothetical protein [Lachnospiraceae bacterium]
HGILEEKLQWTENSAANIYCFVQQNALYSFNMYNNNLTKVFSFYDKDNNDLRTRYDAHRVKILSVDDAGNIRFMVYGYMDRGNHEGEVGACIYFYDSGLNTVEEEIFFPYTKSFQMLKQDMGALSYINRRNILYLLMEGNVYKVNMESRKVETVAEGLDDNRFVSSVDNSMIAWQDGESLQDFDTISWFSLNAAKPIEVSAPQGQIIIPLGFMDSDLIYGMARLSDVTTDTSGSTLVPMYAVRIQNISEGVLKEYAQDGIYIRDIAIEDNMITLKRVVRNDATGYYEETTDDQIMNNRAVNDTKNVYTGVVTEEMETTHQTVLAKQPESDNVKKLTPKHVLFEGSRDIVLNDEDLRDRYYVYVMGDIVGIYIDPAEAINRAEQSFGVVVDKKDSYIWQGGNRYLAKQIKGIGEDPAIGVQNTTACCVDEMLKKQGVYLNAKTMMNSHTVLSLLRENLPELDVLDLTGCSTDAVFYYVSCGYPVLAMVEAGQAVLITGYDSENITLYDPAAGTVEKYLKSETVERFRISGNRFISYINTKQ